MMKDEEIEFGDVPPPRKPHRVYENLGAPCLLYRHKPSYTSPFDAPAASSWKYRSGLVERKAYKIHETWQTLNRAKARWHYPLDQHYTESVTVAERGVTPPDTTREDHIERLRETRRKKREEIDGEGGDQTERKREKYDELDTFDDPEYRKRRALPLVQTGRLAMLLEDDPDPTRPHQLIKDYTSFDHPYISTKYCASSEVPNDATCDVNPIRPRLIPDRWENTRRFAEARRNYADPSYLANFNVEHLQAIVTGTDETMDLKNNSVDSLLPRNYGNCLLSLPCPCVPCSSRGVGSRNWCLFHPSGELLDHICVSNITPPNGNINSGEVIPPGHWRKGWQGHDGRRNDSKLYAARRAKFFEEFPNELDLDEQVMEIKQSGSWDAGYLGGIFVVRTLTHISVLKVTCKRPYEVTQRGTDKRYHFGDDVCWGLYHVEEKNRIDLRSLSRSFPSYRPGSLTCHPKYGNDLTPATFAFLSPSDSNELNVLHHVIDGDTPQIIRHTIPNLKFISLIDFTSTNPMCLWSAAKSYVTPALLPEVFSKKPVFGHGTSLYSVDLRTDSATFQWSPSAEEHMTEGIHSISGIMTDWQRENTVWVTSVSAQKTYEIDTRMPCQAVNSWSLPFGCDEPGINFPTSGFYGEGTLLVQPPHNSYRGKNDPDSPILSVDMTRGSFGFHLYQRPEKGPRFQTPSLECIDSPGLSFTPKTSIATSSIFALPDVSEKIFTCGVAVARMHISQVLEPGDFEHFENISQDTSVLCTVTMTNKGDIYAHSLLENCEEASKSMRFVDLPIGTKAAGIPDELAGKEATDVGHLRKPTGGMNLKLRLQNDYPMPGSAIAPPVIETAGKKHHDLQDLKGKKHHDLKKESKFESITRKKRKELLYIVDPLQNSVAKASSLKEAPEFKYIRDNQGHIAIPLKLILKPQKMISTFNKRLKNRKRLSSGKTKEERSGDESNDESNSDESNSDDSNSDEEKLVARRSDVSQGVLKASLDIWDDFETPKDDSEQLGGSDDDMF
jgi:hypothetical protein